ncbi:MAG: hypothetical protein QOH08_1697 [Chloroflexota bacterium]|nr:hypothetical protein [Chloroflexota bacterium]
MDDVGSGVVRSAHEVGSWRGPALRSWLRRIVTGAGFTRDGDESRLIGRPPQEPDVVATAERDDLQAATSQESVPESLRLWWLPSAREPLGPAGVSAIGEAPRRRAEPALPARADEPDALGQRLLEIRLVYERTGDLP